MAGHVGWRPAPSVLGQVTKWGGKANLAVPSGSLPASFKRRRQLPFDGCFALKIWRADRQPKRVIGPSHLDLATWFSRLIPTPTRTGVTRPSQDLPLQQPGKLCVKCQVLKFCQCHVIFSIFVGKNYRIQFCPFASVYQYFMIISLLVFAQKRR
jgi:hypothetical protein